MKDEVKKEIAYAIGIIGAVMGLVITAIGLIYGLSLGLTNSEIIDKMTIGLIVFLGGMVLLIYYKVKNSNEFFREF